MKLLGLFPSIILSLLMFSCKGITHKNDETVVLSSSESEFVDSSNVYLKRALQTFEAIDSLYSTGEYNLYRENFPFSEEFSVTYLADGAANVSNKYSYLWPFSSVMSGMCAINEVTKAEKDYLDIFDNRIVKGLDMYYDNKRKPAAYASYVNISGESDRFYDDNIWLGIDFASMALLTNKVDYLNKARLIWEFVMSGNDDRLGGGIYWCEQLKKSKNTCSNAPASVFAIKMYQATNDETYLSKGIELYDWTKANLQDKGDYLYYDNKNLEGDIGTQKYAYNSGQMIQAAVLLYNVTNDNAYLEEARNIAASSVNYFFKKYKDGEGNSSVIFSSHDVWFHSIMLRGFVELYKVDGDLNYLNYYKSALDYAWDNAREPNGLFNSNFDGRKDEVKGLLTQGGMVELYANLAKVYK